MGATPIANKREITDEAKAQSFRKIDVSWKTRVFEHINKQGNSLDLTLKDKPF